MDGKDAIPQQRMKLGLLRTVIRCITDGKLGGILFDKIDAARNPINTDGTDVLRLIGEAARENRSVPIQA